MRHHIRWTVTKLENRLSILENRVYRHRKPIRPFRFRYLTSPNAQGQIQTDHDDSSWQIIQPLDYWAYPRTDFILRTTFAVPEEWLVQRSQDQGNMPVALYLPIGIAEDFSHPEALAYIDGEPFASCDRHHQEILLPGEFCEGKEHSLALHGWTGIGGGSIADMTDRLKMGSCEIVLVDQSLRDYLALARVGLGIAKALHSNDPARHHLLSALDESFRMLDLRLTRENDFYDAVPAAFQQLRQLLHKAGPPLDVSVSAIGHAHIDVAWLWTLDQTRQKAGRSFYNVLRNMAQFPEYIFAQSQPQLYDFIQQDFPGLFEWIKGKVKENRWEILGGMWVEADCNLTGPESLARQFLLGRSFFKEHFGPGADSLVLWLPDVFGYAWNLPQLIKEAGLEYFFTIKIGWSQYNRLPYDSFWWQGLDGTKVLTHFSTTKDPGSPYAATYNSDASPGEVIGTWQNFQQKDYGAPGEIPPMLMSYGYGDGGGGPTPKMLENIREMANFPSTPKVKPQKVKDFFKDLEEFAGTLPTWNGELYLEYHRGTYTTQARNKRANRKSEFLLHDAEFLAAYAALVDPDFQYPTEAFNNAWKLVCLNQFHDIIPGSSIGPVYAQSLDQYQEIEKTALEIQDKALASLTQQLGAKALVVNPTSFSRSEAVSVGSQHWAGIEIKPYSIMDPLDPQNEGATATSNDSVSGLSASASHLENNFIRIEFNPQGDITRIYDKRAKREVLLAGSIANQFLAFEDIPLSWDAWDIDIFYEDKVWLAEPAQKIEVVENSPYRCTLRIDRRIQNSDYTQNISLSAHSARIDFNTHMLWRERQTLLKVAFPVDILSPSATYEIQWGNVERPTHRNTSWDWARFETAAQKWVDLSEGGYGVSLLNDCKYGHDIHENVIRLTLLRGTTLPDPTADLGEHFFQYSLLPHLGRWGTETVREAYAINDPLILYSPTLPERSGEAEQTRQLPKNTSLFSVDQENILIETVKQAENGEGIIVRLYEFQRRRGNFYLQTLFPIQKAWRTNLLEENQEEITASHNSLQYSIKPFQILTFRLVLQKPS